MIRNNKLLFLVVFLFLFASCATDVQVPNVDSNTSVSDDVKNEVDQYILNSIRESGAAFNWNEADDETLFKALQISDGALTVGYHVGDEGRSINRSSLVNLLTEERQAGVSEEDVIQYENARLGFLYVKVSDIEMLQRIRGHEATAFVEVRGYPFDIDLVLDGSPSRMVERTHEVPLTEHREMLLDPQSNTPYPDQVAAFDGGLRTVMRRHNMETAYTEDQIFGEGIDIAILDNGILPEREEFFDNNGYGARYKSGYYNPFYFFPWTSPDGYIPRPTDVFGISMFFYSTYYIHGSEMAKMVLTLSPNANINSVRASTWTVIIAPDQVQGISQAIMAMADDPEVDIISMSMGTIFNFNEMRLAIEYFHSKGKLFVCSAGSTAPIINDLLGVLFPGQMSETVTTTAIENRENTGGTFIIGEGSHGGPQNDFTVENTHSSSVACSRTAGMIGLIWSANPSLTRDELIEILIESSYFYQLNGQKDPFFGWGTIDVGLAVELASGG